MDKRTQGIVGIVGFAVIAAVICAGVIADQHTTRSTAENASFAQALTDGTFDGLSCLHRGGSRETIDPATVQATAPSLSEDFRSGDLVKCWALRAPPGFAPHMG